MAMSTLGIYHSELCRISGRKKEEEEDNKTVNTTHSSVTVQRSNVSEFAMEENARTLVGAFLSRYGAETVSLLLETVTLVATVRHKLHIRDQVLSDEAIIQQAREFVRRQPPPPQDVIARNDETAADAVSSLDSSSLRPADGPAHAADDLMNQSVGTISIPQSTRTVDTAKAAVQAAELLQDLNPDGMSDSVHNWEPIHIGNEDAPAVSPSRPVQQQEERRPVQRETAAIANNHHGNGDNRQLSVALAAVAAAGAGDDVGNTSIDNGNGQDEENEDKKPSAKKPPLD